MKISKSLFYIITGALVLIACLGLFEKGAYTFVRSVTDKNLSFLSLVSEVKLVLSGIGGTNIPFVSGDSQEISNTLNKVQNYLLITNMLSLLQLMLLAISKSVILKVVLVLLFIMSFLQWTKGISIKILVLALALNPGLAMYSVAMHHLASEASLDFEESYRKNLMTSVSLLKTEKSRLMEDHAKKLTQINNEGRGMEFFRKFKEDVSYDFKQLGLDIKGDYSHLRALIHNAGQEMVRTIFTFCTMVVFCMFLMPIGYALIIYTLYKRLDIATAADPNGNLTAKLNKVADTL